MPKVNYESYYCEIHAIQWIGLKWPQNLKEVGTVMGEKRVIWSQEVNWLNRVQNAKEVERVMERTGGERKQKNRGTKWGAGYLSSIRSGGG